MSQVAVLAACGGRPGTSIGNRPNRWPKRWPLDGQRGAVAVEAALVVPLIVTMLLGIIDLGVLVHANVGTAAAVRSGARVASSEPRMVGFAEHGAAASLRAGTGLAWSDIEEIWVYRANTSGFPGTSTGFPSYCPSRCIRYRVNTSGQPVVYQGSWAASSIDACVGTAEDVGVRILARHRALAGGVLGPTRISQHAVMRFEPVITDRCRP